MVEVLDLLFKKLKDSFNSLFIKLFLSFLIIIIMLTSFCILSFKHYYDTMIDNIVTNGSAEFKINISKYDEYFMSLQSMVNALNFDINIQKLINSTDAYPFEMVDVLNTFKRKNIPFMDTIFIMIQGKDFVLTQEGSYNKDFFLEYITGNYDKAFWLNLINEPLDILFLKSEKSKAARNSGKLLLPVIFKPSFLNHESYPVKYYFCALIDIKGLYESINMNSDPFFYITGGHGFLYSSNDSLIAGIKDYEKDSTIIKNKSNYVMFSSSTMYDIKYTKVYPLNEINAIVLKLNLVLLYLFIVVLMIATAISIFFSIRFRNPIAKIAEAIASRNGNPDSNMDIHTSISEIKLITSKLNSILIENKRIGKDLSDKNSLLQSYFIQDKIKNINNIKETEDLNIDFPYYSIILYRILFKPDFYEKFDQDSERALNFIKHIIDITVSSSYPGSITFQIESEQFISIINLTKNHADTISDTMKNIHKLTSNDLQYFSIIIAVSGIYQDDSYLNTAYNEALKIMKHRKLNNENQILFKENISAVKLNIYLPVEQEKRIMEGMSSGDKQSVIALIDRILEENFRKNNDAYCFSRLAIEIINNFMKMLNDLKINIKGIMNIEEIYDKLEDYCTIDQYKELLHQLTEHFLGLVGEKKKSNDYISSFVLNYIRENYMQDIYLDLVATKLNLSPNYLSSLFKDKTGINFIDYLNSVRIDKARELLETGTKRINEIAVDTGYNSIHSFIRAFKRYTGKTPNEYRNDCYRS